jgi:3-deoxy-D-manno-octulosonate 8-phosphate phosphatase (KDO 8-P phosphatase)
MSMDIIERARRVTLLVLDCDGVLTDGRLHFSESGETFKSFDVKDGQGIVNWHKAGYKTAIISGRESVIVERRAEQLGVAYVYQGHRDKGNALLEVMAAAGVSGAQVAFVGDDAPDAAVFPLVGFAVAVADAHRSAIGAAHHVTERNGGRGAVREVIDLMLAARIPAELP